MLELAQEKGCTLAAGKGGLDRVVRFVDCMEIPDMKAWMRPNVLYITTGYAYSDTKEEIINLIRNLYEAKAVFNIRALEYEYMMELVDIIHDCARGAAIATRTEVEEKQLDEIIKDVRNDKRLVDYVRKNMDFIGEEYIERDLTQGIGSTDVGNVTHEIPAIQFYVKLKEHVGTHTKEFAVAAGGEEGKRNLHASVQLLAMSALDVLSE